MRWIVVNMILIVLVLNPEVSSCQNPDSIDVIKYPHLKTNISVLTVNVILNRVNLYFLPSGKEWADVSWSAWKQNLGTPPEWDWDLYTTNWFSHPYQGSMFYNAARTLGLTYWQSTGYTVLGTTVWEYFGEVLPPSTNDFFTTILGGIHLGEAIYRISDHMHHSNRAAGKRKFQVTHFMVNPIGELHELIYGVEPGHFRDKDGDINPLVTHLYASTIFLTGSTRSNIGRVIPMIGMEIAYGDPLKEREFIKPWDVFWFDGWLRFDNMQEIGENSLSIPYWNLQSAAILTGKTISKKENGSHILGIFQEYDYIKADDYEIGALGFTGGWIRYSTTHWLSSIMQLRMGPILLGVSDSEAIDWIRPEDPTAVSDFVMGPGVMTKADVSLDFGRPGKFGLSHEFWWLHVLSGPDGNEWVHNLTWDYLVPINTAFSVGVTMRFYHRKGSYYSIPKNTIFKNKSHELQFNLVYKL